MAPSGLVLCSSASPALQLRSCATPELPSRAPVRKQREILLQLLPRHKGREPWMRCRSSQGGEEFSAAIVRSRVQNPSCGADQAPDRVLETGQRIGSRRRFLQLLSSLPLAPFLVCKDVGVAAIAATPPPYEFPEEKGDDQESTIDAFGFDGLGKGPEEYIPGKVVALAQAGDGAVLFVGVDGFELPLQLVVGPAEAMAVLTAVQERKSRRPVTHEAWGQSLAAIGWKVDRVAITGNEGDVFYSCVVLSNPSQLLSNPSGMKKCVDMRPSDGIALALRCKAPLFVCRKVANDILGRKEDLPEKLDPLKRPGLQANGFDRSIFVQNLASSIADRRHAPPVMLFMDDDI